MRLKITWTPNLVSALVGSLVSLNTEVCLLCYTPSLSPQHYFLASGRDGCLYNFGESREEAAAQLNARAVEIYHRKECISLSGSVV